MTGSGTVKNVLRGRINRITAIQGLSAYEVAVKNGYEGTEDEWLLSLKGADGANGADGTNGIDGSSGKSAYEVAVANGYEGTEAEWLESLKGANGTNGVDGTNGTNGKSAYEIAVDNGFEGTQEEWIESLSGLIGADGKDGADGEDGRGIISIGKTATNGLVDTYTIVYTDGTTATITVTNGADGAKGEQGPAGADGRTTYFHVKYSANADGSNMSEVPSTYIGTYVDYTQADSTDPTKYTWTKFVGSDGKDGTDGVPGVNGEDGKTYYWHIAYATSADGSAGFDLSNSEGKSYMGVYVDDVEDDSTDYTKYKWTLIKGADGADGRDGTDGNDGVGVVSVVQQYVVSESNTTAPTSGWSANFDTVLDGYFTSRQTFPDKTYYIWTREKVTYTSGDPTYSTATCNSPVSVMASWCDANDRVKINGANLVAKSVTAAQIDANDLHVKAANIDDALTANQINADGLQLGKLTVGKLIIDGEEQCDGETVLYGESFTKGEDIADVLEGITLQAALSGDHLWIVSDLGISMRVPWDRIAFKALSPSVMVEDIDGGRRLTVVTTFGKVRTDTFDFLDADSIEALDELIGG